MAGVFWPFIFIMHHTEGGRDVKNGFSPETSEFPSVADPYHIEKLKNQHQVLEKRLQELSRRAILTPHEENEVRDIKHQKLQIKDWLTRVGGKEIGES